MYGDLWNLDKSNVCLPLVKYLEVDLWHEEANRNIAANKSGKQNTLKKVTRSAAWEKKKPSGALGPP